MLTRLQGSILYSIAEHNLTSNTDSNSSWFTQIKKTFQKYLLPHPLILLKNHLEKDSGSALIKAKVIYFWESKLRSDASELDSLTFHSLACHTVQCPVFNALPIVTLIHVFH